MRVELCNKPRRDFRDCRTAAVLREADVVWVLDLEWIPHWARPEAEREAERQRRAEEEALGREEEEALQDLGEQAENWQRAGLIRAYLDAAAERIAPLEMPEANREALEAWIEMGRAYADRLDPLQEGRFGPSKVPGPAEDGE